MRIDLHKIPQASPDDMSGLDALITAGKLNPAEILAILGKTEGNGCVNDFTRGFATQSLKLYLAQHLQAEAVQQIVYIMSGGTEGVLSPHLNVFTRREDVPGVPQRWGLVMATQRTRAFAAEEIGSIAMVETVAEAVRSSVQTAGLMPEQVHFVQIKCPLVQSGQKSQTDPDRSSYQSMADSRARANPASVDRR
jgi:cyanuric acid amidohydrolase